MNWAWRLLNSKNRTKTKTKKIRNWKNQAQTHIRRNSKKKHKMLEPKLEFFLKWKNSTTIVQTLSNLFLVSNIETFIPFFYIYYLQSFKEAFKRFNLVNFLEHKAYFFEKYKNTMDQCCHRINGWFHSTKGWWWGCLRSRQQLLMQKLIWNSYVSLNFFWASHVFCCCLHAWKTFADLH